MKKIKLFLAACAAMVGLSAQAQSWTAPTIQGEDPVSGTQYKVMNVGAGTFLDMGKAFFSWSTTAILSSTGIDFTMTADGDNWKFVRTGNQGVFTSGNGITGDAMHVDNTAQTYGITKLANGTYHIHDAGGDASSTCWGYNSYFHTTGVVAHADATAANWNCEWLFVKPADAESFVNLSKIYNARLSLYNEYLKANALGVNTDAAATVYNNSSATIAEINTATTDLFKARRDYCISIATADAPQDLTEFFVVNPDFSTYDATGWTRTQTSVGNQQFGTGAMVSWNNNNVSVLQDLTDLPNGRFRVSCDMISGNDGRTAYVYAKGMTEVEGEHVSAQASAGNYTTMSNEVAGKSISAYPVIVSDHTMTIGFKDPSGWVVVDNFKVLYYGPDLSALKEALQSLIDGVAALEGTTTTAAYNAAKDYADGINVESLNTEDAIATASTELSSRIDAAKALQANYARYQNIKTAALDISSAVATTEADAAVAAATTIEAIDAAVATLRAAFLEELPNVTVPEAGLDVTAVMVDNAGVRLNTNYWTAVENGSERTSGSWAVCNYNECEFYNQNFKFYQTLALTSGTWEFGVTGFHRAGNHTTYFYAGDDKILIPGVESSVVNTMAEAQTYFDNGNGKVALKFALEEAGNIEIGIDNKDTQTDKWTIFRDFTLKYFGSAVDYSVYAQQWTEAVEAANAAKTANANVTGSELTALNEAIANEPTGESKEDYLTKIEALTNATQAFVAAAPAYNAFAAAKAETAKLFGDEVANSVTVPANADAAPAATKALNVAQYNKVVADYPYSLTSKIGEFNTWTGTATSGGNADTPQTLSNEHWSGTTHTYYEQGKNGWASTSFTVTYTKTTTLPAGDYVIKVAARASANVNGTISATATENTVALPNFGASSKGITTAGVASFDEGTFAKDGVGYGWEWRFLPFSLTSEGEVTITINAESTSQYGWVSIADGELLSAQNIATAVEYSDNQENTIEDVDVANVTITRSLKAGLNTIVLPFDLTEAQVQKAFGTGAEVYSFEDVADGSNSQINFNKVAAGTISANVPVLVKAVTASDSLVFEGVQVVAPTADVKVAGKNFDYVGVYAPMTLAAKDYFVSGGKLYKSPGGTNLKAFRAYVKNRNPESEGEVKLFIEGEDGIVTAIDSIDGESVANGAIFNLAGQRVQKAQKGVYIIGGKKVAVK